MSIKRNAALAVIGLSGMVAGTAWAAYGDEPGPVVPLSARVTDLDGNPLSGTHDINVSLFEDMSPQAGLLHEETFSNHPIGNGRLVLSLGRGDAAEPLLSSVLSTHPAAVASIVMDGEAFAPRLSLGSVPFARLAVGLDVGSVVYGGEHGHIPAEAIESPVAIAKGVYMPGQQVANLPAGDGWVCRHDAVVLDPGLAEYEAWREPELAVVAPPDCQGRAMYLASVGASDPGLVAFPTVTIPVPIDEDPFSPGDPLPSDSDVTVYVVRAKRDCGFDTLWEATNVTIGTFVRVTSSCSRFGTIP